MTRPGDIKHKHGVWTELLMSCLAVAGCRACLLQGAAAFISGAALAQDALQAGPEQLQPFAGPQGDHLREMWSELVDSHPDVWFARQ